MYYFVNVEKITSLFELSDVKENSDIIYNHFMNNEDEICYIQSHGDILGIVTIGDMFRFYRNGDKELRINQSFSYVRDVDDYKSAAMIFDKIKTIHEVPVIVHNKLLGIIKSNEQNTKEYWSRQRIRLYEEKEGKYSWYEREIIKLCKKIGSNIFFYNLPNNRAAKLQLSNIDNKALDKKRQYPNGIEGLMMMDETEQMAFWGDKYSKEYVEDFCSDYMKLSGTIKNGVYKIDDLASTNFNFSDGYRNVPNVQKQANRRVFLFGPCTVVGAYVDDSGTIECYLQQVLRERGYQNYQVINCGLFGSQYTLSRLYTEKISKEDIIIVIDEIESIFLNSRISIEDKLGNVYRGNLMEIYVEMKRPLDNIFNAWMHCNYKINKKIADRIFEDINTSLVTDNSTVKERTAIQDYYISWDVISYVREYCKKYQLICENGKCGAIVMNCNPFTKGHRYLIEQATLQVDLLYIFVVEEDKSVFKFEDRIEMVRRGTADLDNVKVLPSGKYIISKETFSQYFEKDNVEQVDDMDYDVRIFGEVVAKELGISVRFVGEEPFDKVTRKYNETMKRILPEYGLDVIEIPRVAVDSGQTISASAVRKALNYDNKELVESMLPESTLEYLMGREYKV